MSLRAWPQKVHWHFQAVIQKGVLHSQHSPERWSGFTSLQQIHQGNGCWKFGGLHLTWGKLPHPRRLVSWGVDRMLRRYWELECGWQGLQAKPRDSEQEPASRNKLGRWQGRRDFLRVKNSDPGLQEFNWLSSSFLTLSVSMSWLEPYTQNLRKKASACVYVRVCFLCTENLQKHIQADNRSFWTRKLGSWEIYFPLYPSVTLPVISHD